MADRIFVDSNIFVYARDASEKRKQPIAEEKLQQLWGDRSGRISAQVLNEYYVTVTRKLDPGLTPVEAQSDVRSLAAWKPLPVDSNLIQDAFEIEGRYGLSWWDSLIVAAAETLGCERILSEDLSRDQRYNGIEVINPFAP